VAGSMMQRTGFDHGTYSRSWHTQVRPWHVLAAETQLATLAMLSLASRVQLVVAGVSMRTWPARQASGAAAGAAAGVRRCRAPEGLRRGAAGGEAAAGGPLHRDDSKAR
jgi:hypothetical protein